MTGQPIYQPDTDYDLHVSRPIKVGSFRYLPRDTIQAQGSLINRIVEEHGADAIRSAEPR